MSEIRKANRSGDSFPPIFPRNRVVYYDPSNDEPLIARTPCPSTVGYSYAATTDKPPAETYGYLECTESPHLSARTRNRSSTVGTIAPVNSQNTSPSTIAPSLPNTTTTDSQSQVPLDPVSKSQKQELTKAARNAILAQKRAKLITKTTIKKDSLLQEWTLLREKAKAKANTAMTDQVIEEFESLHLTDGEEGWEKIESGLEDWEMIVD